MPTSKNRIKKRTGKFLWLSKQLLYDYFKSRYDLDREIVDREIEDVMARFKPRKGQAIMTQELWQKVGFNLTEQYGDLSDLPSEDDIEEVGEVIINEEDEEEVREVAAQLVREEENSDDDDEPVFEVNTSDTKIEAMPAVDDESDEAVFEITMSSEPESKEQSTDSEDEEEEEAVFEIGGAPQPSVQPAADDDDNDDELSLDDDEEALFEVGSSPVPGADAGKSAQVSTTTDDDDDDDEIVFDVKSPD
ncbi:MAG: hypothetical protein GF401_19510 [Chitinivibrionales bacterium]|nr:hypothetical protein [Chitinivibrionales bacterium]